MKSLREKNYCMFLILVLSMLAIIQYPFNVFAINPCLKENAIIVAPNIENEEALEYCYVVSRFK